MADGHSRDHSYHLVAPSPWPIVGAFAALVLTFGMILWLYLSVGTEEKLLTFNIRLHVDLDLVCDSENN